MGLSNSAAGVLDFLYVYLALAFALMITVLNYRTFLKKRGDFRSVLLYFAAFFLAFMAVPVSIIVVLSPAPLDFLHSVGLTLGRSGRGLLITAASAPLALLAAFIGSHDPVMKEQYPFSKEACASTKKFILYEACYLVLYYLPWEFLFRGVLFFPLVPAIGLVPALGLQTIVSTLYHFGHPDSEVYAALGSGLVFGFIAHMTGSFIYTVVIHAMAGIANDYFLYSRFHRPGRAA